MKFLKAAISLLVALGLVFALNRPWGALPALGPFISPFTGFWQNGEPLLADSTETVELKLDSLRESVTIRYDDVGVPHIFATNTFDVYYAQGYVTAKDRLWQMDLQTRAAAGRLSEVLGNATVEMDRRSRRMGMGYGAEVNLKTAMSDPVSREALLGYTAGINTYIRQLKPKDFPIEFKLLGYEPELWTPLKCMYMLEQMTLTLAGRADDLAMTNLMKALGKDSVDDIFPNYPKLMESPIIPAGTPWNFTPLPIPKATAAKPDSGSMVSWRSLPLSEPNVEGLGSNNWAVSAEKSATGYPILANDPHLELTLPSIWYQVQLTTPDMNVYGVSLPGIPGVVIGFNKNVAWGVTNVDADVLDLYQITFRDSSHTEYKYNNAWQKTRKREELIVVKGLDEPIREMVVYTHHGPVLHYEGESHHGPSLAVKWIGHEPGNSFKTFYELNIAKNYDDYRQALTHYVGPAQNFIFADNGKNIAMTVNGKFPLKWKEQGKYVLDGSNPAHDWQGWIPADQNPHVKNPVRGFVSSANQSSTAPDYPYYINWRFAPSERGIRINERLDRMTAATADSLRDLQNDNFSVLARTILPTLLTYLNSRPLNASQKAAYQVLESWDMIHSPEALAPSIFDEWTNRLATAIWKDELHSDSLSFRYPTRDRTLYLILNEPNAVWFDDKTTAAKETIGDIVYGSFKATLDTLTSKHGPMSPAWQWATVKNTEIRHLSRLLKPFNAPPVQNGGGGSMVNATTRHHGPSWRMVVELGPEPKAYGLYPGGQSGNPGSPLYSSMLDKWEKGELNPLLYLASPKDTNPRLTSTWILTKK
ncbi:penicillin acylase family protein [Arundinibacter roseus]|uniref:Penicillin acylase family protein n=1 Tax=Arundinibacter roseus TaxID=2070510 RepID=A0A4V6P8G1_9BACT|nr:penicillin acylase family protein [Arundinibacter roseus]TDB58105.1 penicillin acylase family protein [Arundinibacter roseus]